MARRYCVVLICFIFLLPWVQAAGADSHLSDIEIVESGISIDQQQFPATAYLSVTLKNGGDSKVSNLTFEIKYFDAEDNLIQKAIVNNFFHDALVQGETRKLKISLKGNIVHIENAQYPYAQSSKISGYDIRIINAKYTSK